MMRPVPGVGGLLALLALATASLPAAPPTKQQLTFQQGVNGYSGTVDTEIWAFAPTKIIEKNGSLTADANNDGGESQVLMRFEGIVGDGPRQIPKGARVRSATLVVAAFDMGNTVNLHRLLVNWDRCATWNSLVGGVTADGLEASRHKDSFTFGRIAANKQRVQFEVTDTVQAWVNGAKNHGWVFINTGGNGWDFYASEYEEAEARPMLLVEFDPPESK